MSLPRPHRFLGGAPRGPRSPGASPSSDFVAPPPCLPRRSHCARRVATPAARKLPHRRAVPEGRALFRAHRGRDPRVVPVPAVSAHAVSHRLDALLHSAVAGLLHPAPVMGFTVFCVSAPRCLGRSRVRATSRAPRCWIPLDEFHSSAAVPHHCDRCLLAVPPPSALREEGCPPAPAHPRCEHLGASHDARWRATSASAAIETATPDGCSPTHSVVPHPPSSPAPQLPAAQVRIHVGQRAAHQDTGDLNRPDELPVARHTPSPVADPWSRPRGLAPLTSP